MAILLRPACAPWQVTQPEQASGEEERGHKEDLPARSVLMRRAATMSPPQSFAQDYSSDEEALPRGRVTRGEAPHLPQEELQWKEVDVFRQIDTPRRFVDRQQHLVTREDTKQEHSPAPCECRVPGPGTMVRCRVVRQRTRMFSASCKLFLEVTLSHNLSHMSNLSPQ